MGNDDGRHSLSAETSASHATPDGSQLAPVPTLELTLKIFSPAPPGWELLRLETVLQLCTVCLNQRRCVGGVEK